MNDFCSWLAATSLSAIIKDVTWIIPLAQTLHILSVAAVFSSVCLIEAKLFGLSRNRSMQAVASTQLRWIWRGLVVLAITGLILIIGEPSRELLNNAFWTKMILLAAAITLAGAFQILINRDRPFPPAIRHGKAFAVASAVFSLAIWVGIVTAGRWIAYYSTGD
jgi:Family of unknown function (DUF6644)